MSENKSERRGLGRGLSALMADVGLVETATGKAAVTPGVREVPISQVRPNPDQPRRTFDPEALDDLAESIRIKGVLQPLLVRERHGVYEIVAGERRWRASQMAKRTNIPVIVREYSDTEVLEVAIIENIQRSDLTPVDEAQAYRQLIERFGHTQEKVAESLGKSRSYIANTLRLLTLPQDVVVLLEKGELSSGHARALVTSDNASVWAKKIVDKGLTVRDVERLVREEKTAEPKVRKYAARGKERDADTVALENDLSANLNDMKVRIQMSGEGVAGALTINFASLDDLDLLCRLLSSNAGSQDY